MLLQQDCDNLYPGDSMKTILIAIQSEILAQQLQEQLSQLYPVLVCYNGQDAAEILLEQNPEVLVLDLRISGIDGITLLQAARDSGIGTQVIALADYMSDYIIRALEQLKVCCLMRYDCKPAHLTARILELLYQDQQEDPQLKIRRILAQLGFKMNTQGFRIIEQALFCYWQDPSQPVTTQLYPKVAELCGGSASQVEKAIRSSVEAAWKSGDKQLWRMYFTFGKNGKPVKPSNGDFLSRISHCVAREKETPELEEAL